METLGLLGGMGPESTIAYYRKIVQLIHARSEPASYPNLIVISLDMVKMLQLVGTSSFDELADFLSIGVRKASMAGASFAAVAACTPHIVLEQVQARCAIPLLSIVDATVDRAIRYRVRTIGLVGSQFTMQGEFFKAAFRSRGIEVVTPSLADQEYIHTRYFGELVQGIVRSDTREAFNAIFLKLRNEHHAEAIVLAGTELALLYENSQEFEMPLLDTTAIHIEALVEKMLSATETAQPDAMKGHLHEGNSHH